MLEAVNSVLQNAQFVRSNSEQTSSVDSFAANPERSQRVAPQAPYISPYIHLDVNYDKAVILLRNGETGDVEGQFPSQATLEAQARAAAKRQVAVETEAATPSPKATEAPQAPAPQQKADAAISAQQQAAFSAAARSGNTNAGNITLFA